MAGDSKSPPRDYVYSAKDTRAYMRRNVALLLTILALYGAAAMSWIPIWALCVALPPVLSRQALTMHELIHIAPASSVDPLTRVFVVLDSPLSLGYRELRDIHLRHHRHAATEQDPEWHQIRGPAPRALLAALVAIERGAIEWVRTKGVDSSLAVTMAVRAAAWLAAALASPQVFLCYWLTLRITVGVSQFGFHHMLHCRGGRYSTYSMALPRVMRVLAALLISPRYLPIITHHDAHDAWPSVRVERLAGLLDAYPKRAKV